MKNIDRMIKLYADWASAQDDAKVEKATSILESSTTESSKFIQIFDEMGEDGKKMRALFNESWADVADNKMVAKKKIAKSLLEANEPDKKGNFFGEFGLAYTPIADMKGSQYDSNQMQTTVSDGDRDILIQIRSAITSGSYNIAGALIINFWPRLSIAERVAIMQWVYNLGNYNSLTDVPKSRGVGFKEVKEKIESKKITKEDFKDSFLRTAKERMKAE